MTTATLCEHGQVTIPQQFRTRLGLQPGMKVSFRLSGETLQMTPRARRPRRKMNPFEAAYGSLKPLWGDMRTDDLIREMRGC